MAKGFGIETTIGFVLLVLGGIYFFPTILNVINNQAMLWFIGLLILVYFLKRK